MELRANNARRTAGSQLANNCAQCGEAIPLPEWSEYLDRARVRHLWACDGCGYKFETTVQFAEA